MNPNDSLTLWSSYKTTEERAGPLPSTSTPLKTPRSQRVPEELNVTSIVVDTEQDENRNLGTSTQHACRSCRELKNEIQDLRKTVEKQAQYIEVLKKSLNSTSEMDSSESLHGNGSTASSHKKTQRVTPTKRETSASTSSSTSSSTSTPVVRQILQNIITPRSASVRPQDSPRSSNQTPTSQRSSARVSVMTRNVRPETNRTSSSESPSAIITPTPTSRRPPPSIRIPQSEPLGARPRHARFESNTLPSPRQQASTRRSQSRRRLFANEDQPQQQQHDQNLSVYHRTLSENAIEHLNISPIKGNDWMQACPPRLHLERNRPKFIENLELRQSIIRAASEKRQEIEYKKRMAARAVASGQKSVESVSRDLFADATSIRAFYEKDIKDLTLKNIRKSQSYQNRMQERIVTVDRHANRILAQTHSIRARSTSRNRQKYY